MSEPHGGAGPVCVCVCLQGPACVCPVPSVRVDITKVGYQLQEPGKLEQQQIRGGQIEGERRWNSCS